MSKILLVLDSEGQKYMILSDKRQLLGFWTAPQRRGSLELSHRLFGIVNQCQTKLEHAVQIGCSS
jgi:hypothetical protein